MSTGDLFFTLFLIFIGFLALIALAVRLGVWPGIEITMDKLDVWKYLARFLTRFNIPYMLARKMIIREIRKNHKSIVPFDVVYANCCKKINSLYANHAIRVDQKEELFLLLNREIYHV